MPSSYPAAPDDLSAGNTDLTHGEVSDAVAAVQATLGVNPQGDDATVAARLDGGLATGPDTNVHAVWHIDGGGTPIDADAGSYQLGSNSPLLITINVGDDQAAIQTAYDDAIVPIDGGAGYYTATVVGDWSDFTVELSHRILGLDTYININALTLLGNPVPEPTYTNTEPGHGIYEATPGLMADIIGRATPTSPFTGTTGLFMDPTSEQYSDAGFVQWAWRHGSTRGVRDLLGATIDKMDVQRLVQENSTERIGEVNVQAYSSADTNAVRLFMRAQIGIDGTARNLYLRAEDDNRPGRFELSITDPAVQAILQATTGQTDPLLDLQDEAGTTTFRVTPAGEVHAAGGLVLTSPLGVQYRLIVDEAGALSTEAV